LLYLPLYWLAYFIKTTEKENNLKLNEISTIIEAGKAKYYIVVLLKEGYAVILTL